MTWTQGWGSQEPGELKQEETVGGCHTCRLHCFSRVCQEQSLKTKMTSDPYDPDVTMMAGRLFCMHWWRVTVIICGHGLSRRTFELVISKYCWVRVEQLTKSRIWFVSKFRLWIFFKKKTLQYIKLASDVITGLSLVVASVFVPVCRFRWLQGPQTHWPLTLAREYLHARVFWL